MCQGLPLHKPSGRGIEKSLSENTGCIGLETQTVVNLFNTIHSSYSAHVFEATFDPILGLVSTDNVSLTKIFVTVTLEMSLRPHTTKITYIT